jgi:hypothetical protein
MPLGGSGDHDSGVPMDSVTNAYLRAAGEPGSRLGRAVEQVESAPALSAWGKRFINRPLFVDEAEMRRFADDLQRLLGLLLELPDRLFDGSLERFGDAIGVAPERSAMMRRLGVVPPACGRADVYHDGDSYWMLEFGIGSDHGGWDRSGEIPRAFLRDEAFAEFAAEHRLGYTHSATELVKALRGVAGGEPVVALVEAPGALAQWGGAWRPLRQVLSDCGLRSHVGELGDLTVRGGHVYMAGDRVDVVYRCFDADQLLDDPDALALAERIFKLHEAGNVVLWTPLETNLFCEKECMTLLSDHAETGCFSAEEQAVIDRVIPWTRSLNGRTDAGLLDRCRANRERLILKPSGLFGGRGVVPGWKATDSEWSEALREGAAMGAVIQRRVVPAAEPVFDPVTQELQPWHAVHGFYYTPTGFAGTHARIAPADRSAVIGLMIESSTKFAGVFHVMEGP